MNRDEILSRVSKDKKEFDEMETDTVIKALGISTIVVPIFCLLFMIVRIIRGDGDAFDLIAITFSQLTVYEVYRYIKEKEKVKLIISVFFTIVTIVATIMFFL